ncbi:MAG TPA: TlpA disulfide reductase family protein [Chitinophagaceae bacterium]|nr:TlpA disulfide reductase family protein [Chitinophagaceae bacterium]
MKKMTTAFLACLTSAITYSQGAPQSFTLEGKITGDPAGKLIIYYTGAGGKQIKDSTVINSNTFIFKGKIAGPVMAYLQGNVTSMSMDDPNTTSFFIEPGTIHITLKDGDFKHAVITGSKTQEEAKILDDSKAALVAQLKPLEDAYTKINNTYIQAIRDKKPEALLDSLHEKAAAMHDELQSYSPKFASIDYAFFRAHPSSYVTAFNLRFYINDLPLDSLKMIYARFGTAVQQSVYGREIDKQIKQLESGSPGAIAKNFVTTDINGNKLSLADFKGKYVLLDFWASWCIPCRHSNPHLKELYTKYHNKGFDIIGVSDDDRDDSAWRKAVAKDGIGIWHHVLRGFSEEKMQKNEPNDNDISGMFGIHSLPTKILIDKNGVIVGRYDQATDEEQQEMDNKLAEVMK